MIYNATNKHVYAPANVQALDAAKTRNGWPTGEFAGFHQWKAAGRIVKKGEQGTPVVFFVPKKGADGETVKVRKVKHVFNIAQTEQLETPLTVSHQEAVT